jgi:hypothetical protein
LPGAESRRVTVRQLTEALIADYTLRDRHSIKGVQSHLKQVTGESSVTCGWPTCAPST